MNLYGLTRKELEDYFLSIGEKKFKATQVYEWLYDKRVTSISEFSNIKKEIRDKLNEDFTIKLPTIIQHQSDRDAEKFLFNLEDNEKIEAVVMYHNYGISVCVSSEVGCNMGCKFCESGRLKKVRNLWAYEMVGQILAIESVLHKKISSVVIMGIGEPLDNYLEVIKFIKIINDAKGLMIGARHITLSTCGLIPKIKELSNLDLQINLAISLHASNDTLRNKIMPINKVYPLPIEYIMLKGINDEKSNALELASLLRGLNVYVNLIPYNETNNLGFKKSDKAKLDAFYDTLKKEHINVTVRREFGSNIDAACGQLRSKNI